MKVLRISELMVLENKITERVWNDGTKKWVSAHVQNGDATEWSSF